MKQKSSHSKSHKAVKSTANTSGAGKPRSSARWSTSPPPAALVKASLSTRLEPQTHGGALKRTEEEKPTDTGVPTPDPKKQWWYRKPDSKTRKVAEKIAVLDALGIKDEDIAKKLKTTPATVKVTRFLARKNGWWNKDDEPIDQDSDIALELHGKIVRNISASLDGKMTNWQTHEMTIAAAKGRGVFKNHEAKADQGAVTMGMIGIQIIMPPLGEGDQRMEIPDSMIGGVPSYIEGEVGNGLVPGQPAAGEVRALPSGTGSEAQGA